MPSEAQASWSGSLKSKKKSELQQICRQLHIEHKSESLKADLEQQIRHRFQEVPSLQEDERFVRLDHTGTPSVSSNTSAPTSRRGTRARSVSRPPRVTDEDQQKSAEDDRPRSIRSPSRTTTLNQNSTNPQPSAGTQKILVTVVNTEKDLSRHTPSKSKTVPSQPTSDAQQLIKQSGQQALESFNAFTRYTARQTINVVQTIQKTFSCPWKLCVIAILAELTFVIYSTVPHRQGTHVHPKSDGYSITIPEPMIRLFHRILSKSFLKPFLGYLSLTVIAPFVIGGLMNVPSSSQEKDKKPKFKAARDLKPNVFVYCATRLAVLSLVHLVFYPNYHFGWASQTLNPPIPLRPSPSPEGEAAFSKHFATNIQLHGFEYLQYVTTTFGMLIALHRSIRSPV